MFVRALRAATALLFVFGLAGCAATLGHAGSLAPASKQSVAAKPAPAAPAQSQAVVHGDDLQTRTENLNASGGTLYVPAISEFHGSVTYPSNNAPAGTTVTLSDSTTDSFGTPAPPKGKAIFYLQIVLNGSNSITFNAGTIKGRLVLEDADQDLTYTVYAYSGGVLVYTSPPVHLNQNDALTFKGSFPGGTLPGGSSGVIQLVQD